jgi:eukaryotic-like serine/threonine-protein kinase
MGGVAMKPDRNDNEPLTSPVSTMDEGVGESSCNNTVDDGPGSTCDDGATDWKHWVSVESTIDVSISDADGLWNAIGSALELPEDVTDLDDACVREADGTFCWDPQETCSLPLESTVWPLGSSLLGTTVSRTELVAGFEILSDLGHGGMGIVYKARHLRLKRLVALKVIRYDRHSNPEDLARFEIEAEVVARLNHPNIVRIYEIGKADGVPFVALELLEGGTLKDRLAGTPQPQRETAKIMSTLARAVHAAHEAGVLHRDIKPSNVLFDREGTPKIADFGLAKRMDVEEGETITGQVIGTPSYMAPEQARGWAREIGDAADIYSLGAILYEMMTGRPPIKGETQAETLKLVLEEDPVTPSHLRPKVSFDLETICLKCIARDPQRRYANALALAEDLDRFLEGEPILARRTPIWERAIKLSHRHPVFTAVLAIGLVAAGSVGGWYLEAAHLENGRLEGVLQTAGKKASDAEGAIAKNDWTGALKILSGLVSGIEKETDERIAQLRLRAQSDYEQADRGLAADQEANEARERAEQARIRIEAVRSRLSTFREHLEEAKFLDARFGGLEPDNAVEATCQHARASLATFGSVVDDDLWTLAPLPAELTARERDEVTNGFYELLLILADAVAQSPGASHSERAEQALRIVDRAPRVRSTATRAYHLRRSAYLESKGDPKSAFRERQQADRLAPEDAFDFFLVGRDLAMKSDWNAAIANFRAALQKQPDHFWAQCMHAIGQLQLRDPSKAVIGLNACLQQKLDCPWLYLLRGLAYGAQGKLARDLAARDPEDAIALSATAAENFEAAEADYRTALTLLEIKPMSSELPYVLLVNRGYIRIERDDLDAAAVDLEAAAARNNHRYEAFSGLAHVYQRQGRTDLALAQIATAVRLAPERPELHRARADLLLGLEGYSPELKGVVLHDLETEIRKLPAQRRDDALRELDLALKCESAGKRGVAFDKIRQAVLFHVSDRNREALDACDATLAIAPRVALAHQMRIKVLLDSRQYDDLIHSCDLALGSVAPSAELYELRGMAKDRLGNYSGAIDDYTLSLWHKPDTARVLRHRGWSFLAQDAFKLAENDFDAAVRLAPTDPDAYSGRALVRAQLGRHEGAAGDAERSLQLAPRNWRFACNAARVYALSAVKLEFASRKISQPVDRVVKRYLDRAYDHARLALELAPAEQHKSILADPQVAGERRGRSALAAPTSGRSPCLRARRRPKAGQRSQVLHQQRLR